MNMHPTDHDSFENELRASAADVLRKCDSDVAPGVVRAIRERSIKSGSIDDGPIRGWFGWREAVGVAAAVALAGGVWWSGFESGRAASEAEIARGQAVVRTLPKVGDRAGSMVRVVLANAEWAYDERARELGAAGEHVAQRMVDGISADGLWERLSQRGGEADSE